MRKLTLIVITVCGTAACAAASVAAASSKTEQFMLMTTSTGAGKPTFSVIATGAFTDGGITTHESKGDLTLRLSSGTITLRRTRPHGHGTKTETASSCMQTTSSRFSYSIVDGTGAYKGITGSGRATEHDAFVEHAVNGSCGANFAAAQGIITLDGTASLP